MTVYAGDVLDIAQESYKDLTKRIIEDLGGSPQAVLVALDHMTDWCLHTIPEKYREDAVRVYASNVWDNLPGPVKGVKQ